MPVLLFLAYLVAEIAALALAFSTIGVLWTSALLIAGSVVGVVLVRSQGRKVFAGLRRASQSGGSPTGAVADGVLVALGAVLMFVPGLVTSALGLVLLLWAGRRASRTDLGRAGVLLWGGWLLVTGVVFSYMAGTMHPYYTVALAPAIGGLVGITALELWKGRQFVSARITLAAMLAATGIWGFVLLDRTPDWYPALRWIVLVGSIVVAAIIAVGVHQLGKLTAVVAAAGLLFGLAGTSAYTLETATTAHTIFTSAGARCAGEVPGR